MRLLPLIVAAAQATASPTPQPSSAAASQAGQAAPASELVHHVHVDIGGGMPAYLGCIRQQTAFWMSDPAPATHVDAVMAACDPLVPAAAADTAPRLLASPAFAKPAAAYLPKQGHPVDLVPALEHEMRRTGRSGAANILAGDKGQQTAAFKLTLTPDEVREDDPALSPTFAPAGDRPVAPASGSR